MKKLAFALTAILLASSCSLLQPKTTRSITFRGTAELKAAPDVANFFVTVRSEAKTVIEAQQKMTEQSNNAIALFKEKGLSESDLQTTSYNTNPKYEYQNQPCKKHICPPAKIKLSGYEASQTISLKLRDIKKSGEILSAIAELGISEVNGPSFSFESPDKLRSKVQEMAIAQAKAEAQLTAKNLGVKLGRIINFSEESFRQFESRSVMMAKTATFENAASATQIEAGAQKVSATVNITYEIED